MNARAPVLDLAALESVGAERAVLAGFMLAALQGNGEVPRELCAHLSPDDFASPRHRTLFEAAASLVKESKPTDLVSVTDRLRERGLLQTAGGAAYITSLMESIPIPALALTHAQTVAKLAMLRRLHRLGVETAHQIAAAKLRDPAEAIEGYERVLRQEAARSSMFPDPDALVAEDVLSFVERPIPVTEAVVSAGMLPRGGSMFIGGEAKRWKTMLGQNLAICVAAGRPFLGFGVPAPRRTLYLQQEVAEAQVQKRLRTMLQSVATTHRIEPGTLHILNVRGLKLDTPGGVRRLDRLLRGLRPEMVIFDPFYKIHNSNENKTDEMAALCDRLDKLMADHEHATVIIHHHAKPGLERREGAQQLRGSSVLFAWGDSYLTINRYGEPKARRIKLAFELRNAESPDPMILQFDPLTLWFDVVASQGRGKVTLWDVVQVLKHAETEMLRQAIITAVREKTGSSDRPVREIIAEAERRGMIRRVRRTGRGNPVAFVAT